MSSLRRLIALLASLFLIPSVFFFPAVSRALLVLFIYWVIVMPTIILVHWLQHRFG